MGWKSRGCYNSFCIKDCENRNTKCDECYKYSEYRPKGEDVNGAKNNQPGCEEHPKTV